ncbi:MULTISPECIES: helicase-related protein [Commensalibacter]|uniref:RNA helicase n=2 Tax=Commensalibacter TaxID=1079922 RepID=W7DTR0_9PROT|nr:MULTISPECIES: helicase-related protein [Commensalibacter]EUK18360.1 RNA helicase [Commensalibacter papalotli (ex Servin-Garciduenas et al. 2014)]CAI3935039.1 Superfamily II RNA helicase (Dob10) (PDB:4A4Z) [Commensalibacter papalotli (ex Botero et al. 2024)]CAI3940688.1 Superfamily II RNA helicase (Dob10) (PDB:4A4Z) [Commensalibacter papalotli (ex Botero et al. 2024)]
MNLSPAKIAIDQALQETSLSLTPQEEPRLLKLVARNLQPDTNHITAATFIKLLCIIRRKEWAKRLNRQIQQENKPWIQSEDIAWAVSFVHEPEPSEDALQSALQQALHTRLRQNGKSPIDCFQTLYTDLIDSGKPIIGTKALRLMAQDVAIAFGLESNDTEQFIEEIVYQEQKQQQKDQEIQQTARDRKRDEIKKQKEWESSLVSFKEIPPLLHCSHKEVLRWIAENKIPVAQKIKKHGKEIWRFDPKEIKALRSQISNWRDGTPAKDKKNAYINLGDLNIKNKVIASVAAMDRYAGHFVTARSLKRRITIVTGPTNSGKSYTALKTMAESESGIALAPLRLLAHEFKEALSERNIAASLKTGEERQLIPNSRFLAATVEMCPMDNPVDVALIDEAQMLTDPDRGAAWTAAIMGVPARHVYVLGSPECIPIVKNIARLCDDPWEEISLQRKSALQTASSPIGINRLQAGDALIAFSRREVLDLRAILMQKGHSVAVIYGALSPEVRRAEAKRFNDGQADILIATDAIGMGLNLSIKRIIFSTIYKFDGTSRRMLTSQEVKQIGGRAGRYGKHETGTVGLLAGAGDPDFIRRQLEAPPEEQKDLRPLVQPDSAIVQLIANEINSDSLFGVLTRLKRAVLRSDDPNYRLAPMEETFAIASALEGVQGLELRDRWTYSVCPVDDRDNGIQRLIRWAADHASGKTIAAPSTGKLPSPSNASRQELERAEKRHKRLVAWRWLSLRFPDIYPDLEAAEKTTRELNDWIESVLRQQRRKNEL